MKAKAAAEAGIAFQHKILDASADVREVVRAVDALNADPSVHGLLVQLPLSDGIGHVGERAVTEAVSADKDVDGFGALNIGKLQSRADEPLFAPCTPAGCIALIESTGVPIAGANAVVLGRSDIVGSPVCAMLRRKDATVTQLHSRSKDIQAHLSRADIVVAAIGKAEFVRGEWLKPGCVVIDVGTNFVPDASKKSGQRLVGDVHFESAKAVASFITPVPGGVGPMTVAMLMQNTFVSAERVLRSSMSRKVRPLPLDVRPAVPSDIEIAMAQTPKLVADLAREIGVLPTELEQYGPYKAKVALTILDRLQHRRNGKYIVVAGVSPTPLGEERGDTARLG